MSAAKPTTSSGLSRGWRAGLIGLAVSVLAIYFVVSQLDMALLAEALLSARYIYVIPSLALLTIGLYTRALRWRGLLRGALPVGRAFHILNVSYLVNGILPLRLGEVARAYLAYRAEPSVTIPRAISTIVVERLLDLLAVLGLIALAASAALPPELRAAAIAVAPLALGGLVVLVLMARSKTRVVALVHAIAERVALLRRLPFEKLTHDVLDGFAALATPRAFVEAVGWTIVSWIFSVAAGFVLMYAFWETADWAASMMFIAAASFAIALPAVPGNIGTFEASILLGLSPFDYGPLETATAFAVIVHAATLLLYAVMGGIGLMREGIGLAQLQRSVGSLKTSTEESAP